MPTYQVYAAAGFLDPQVKQALAREITRAHHAVTGASNYFAQVMFHELAPGDLYIGGSLARSPHLFVHGCIRARNAEVKRTLIERLRDAVAEVASLDRRFVWVYLSELPASQMVEFGYVLPAPGEEESWARELAPEDREYMMSLDFQAKRSA